MNTDKLYDLFEQIEASTSILLEELQDFQIQVDKLKDALDRLEIELIVKEVADAGTINIRIPMTGIRKQFISDFLREEKTRLLKEEAEYLDRMLTLEEVNQMEMELINSIFTRIDQLNKLNLNQ
jgi:UTP-glucose-1-phosphate uridylyltransferase